MFWFYWTKFHLQYIANIRSNKITIENPIYAIMKKKAAKLWNVRVLQKTNLIYLFLFNLRKPNCRILLSMCVCVYFCFEDNWTENKTLNTPFYRQVHISCGAQLAVSSLWHLIGIHVYCVPNELIWVISTVASTWEIFSFSLFRS